MPDSVLEKSKSSSIRSNLLENNTKAASPTLSESSNSSSLSSNKAVGNIGSVKSKAANLNLSLGNNSNFVNNKNSQITKTASTNSLNSSISSNFKNNNVNLNISNTSYSTSTTSLSTTTNSSIRNLAPNKSSLFGTNSVGGGSGSDSTTPSPPIINKSPTPGIKPVLNHGKPNFAPKPPGLQQLALSNGQRPLVSRHHSMKSPRSPPISTAGGPVFGNQQHFGTMRTPQQLCQSQDAINLNMRTAPNPPIGRPTVAPPKPPTAKPPPPPTPARSISNSNLNLNNLTHNTSTGGNSSAAPCSAINTALVNTVTSTSSTTTNTQSPSNSSSSSSVSTLREQFKTSQSTSTASTPSSNTTPTNKSSGSPVSKNNSSRDKGPKPIILNGGPIIAPPLPPHRTCPAPPPPQRQTSNTSGGAPPVPPQRHSSIRANAPLTPPTTGNAPSFGNISNANSVSRLVIDLESKFGKRFHNVTEFPKPPPFLNVQKIYPSRTIKATNAPNENNNNNSDNNNSITSSAVSTVVPTANPIIAPKPLQPPYQPFKKHRAPAPPPQAGVAAATVSVIRQSSFLYGGNSSIGQTQNQATSAAEAAKN